MIDLSQLVVAIDTHREGTAVLIRPHIENPTPLTLRYHMAVNQSSAAGTSSISQQGDLQTGASSSVVRLSIPPEAACTIHLDVFQDGVLVKSLDKSCDETPG
ncbi:curli-like amyloid fiber formation chaperone CsgH [Pseudomonas sp. UBA1879]|uniref:curli-like amyloid fiber formation chaperone CsgH n=1 Tax=Pseudomonas sp. UBA1879 TaxID=1947305 RepID=UPI0025D5E961|nr:curli-like amyloid fiber formation chaperone CsgH [Pseudomonas sp. UBA1879]